MVFRALLCLFAEDRSDVRMSTPADMKLRPR